MSIHEHPLAPKPTFQNAPARDSVAGIGKVQKDY